MIIVGIIGSIELKALFFKLSYTRDTTVSLQRMQNKCNIIHTCMAISLIRMNITRL